MKVSLWVQNKEYTLDLKEKSGNGIQVVLNGSSHHVDVQVLSPEEMLLNIDGRIFDVLINGNSSGYSICIHGKSFRVEKRTAAQMLGGLGSPLKKADIKTSMPGRIVKILVKPGDEVEEGQPVLILEAMKMQNEIKSPRDGTVSRIVPEVGQSVESNSLLFSVE